MITTKTTKELALPEGSSINSISPAKAFKWLLFAFLFLIAGNTKLKAQQAGSDAFIDINKALQAIPGYADSIKKLDDVRMMYQNQYNYLLVDLQQRIKEYEARKDSFSGYVANIKLAEIKQGQANLDTFQMVANTALQMQQDQIISRFIKEIRDAVAQIGAAKKLGTVWDAALLKNAVWTDPKSDITEEVIQTILNKRNAPVAPAGKTKK